MRPRALPMPAPAVAADQAGLRYVSDQDPGIRRLGRGPRFRYAGPDGRAVRDADTLRRIRALAIPPAWTDVWICADPDGHIQASGRDARRRKQYRYHARWRSVRDETKFDRLVAFGEALPRIRRRVARDLELPGLPRDKVLATVVRILESTGMRVGNEEYVKQNRHFGLTTLRARHVEKKGPKLRFEFPGKGGKQLAVELEDPRVARIVGRCQSLPGQELFQYLDHEGNRHKVRSDDVNDYLREVAGREFSAKDCRTWVATLLAQRALAGRASSPTARLRKQDLLAAIDEVAGVLGNTRAICRKSYIHPAVVECWERGRFPHHGAHGDDIRAEERALLTLLRAEQRAKRRSRALWA